MKVTHRLTAAILVGLLVSCGNAARTLSTIPSDAGPTPGQGHVEVLTRHCDTCHQSPDPAEGVLSGQTTPVMDAGGYGSNLTPDPDTGMDAWDAGSIAAAILDGVDDQGQPLCPGMPRWGDAGMTQNEALSIAAYLQSLTPVWHPVPASICLPSAEPTRDAGGPP